MFLRAPLAVVSGLFASSSSSAAASLNFSPEQIEAAKAAAYAASPHNYEIILANPAEKISFLVIGCQGNAKKEQLLTANLMDRMVSLSQPSAPLLTAASAASAASASSADQTSLPSINLHCEDMHAAAEHKPRILFGVGAGDSFYDEGVQTPNDPAFDSHFYQVYNDRNRTPALAALPWFMLQGNHDQGRWKKGEFKEQLKYEIGLGSSGLKGKDLGMNQVAHSYLGDTPRKQALYNQSQLALNELPPWNMPNRYYSLIIGKMQIFMIDSNTYASDYLQLINGVNIPYDNQARWLKEQVTAAKAAGRDVMLILHHPLFTPGKRAYNSDITLYLTPDEIEQARVQFKQTFTGDKPPYNTLLWDIFKRQELIFKAVFAAHDHSLSYFNNRESTINSSDSLCQIISAGAGGSLQQRRNFNHQNSMGCFLKKHGVVQVTFNPANTNDVQFDVVAIDTNGNIENHIIFSSEHCKPVLRFPAARNSAEMDEINTFFAVVKSAIDEYCGFLGQKQDEHGGGFFSRNLSHRDYGIDRVHELWAYISDSRTCQYDFARIVAGVHDITSWQSAFSPAQHSLITILNIKMTTKYHMTIEDMHLQCQRLMHSSRRV